MNCKRYVKILTYPVAGAFALGVVPPPHHHGKNPVSDQTELYALLPWHSLHDHPESPNRSPLPYVQVAPMSSTAVPGLNLAHYDELLDSLVAKV